ncbi:erg2 C-8 sterol isomerase [Emericellopsis atlantica]|uniref:C-8 sterol isomerase n=1 Tax=Emericellopsis atlantica TaxID=2614577 RepID=A0A9P8CQR1_9HYPO|nr:erg2 C-8 sterol isomerase [Emericellopsis atlantica]KAG9255390.1 erg2 C-8 sterol isomerase [Emericellopsis atlantica]
MPSKKTKKQAPPSMGPLLAILALLTGLFASVIYMIDQHADNFYIFDPSELHNLSQRAIAAHGEDMHGIKDYIVSELSAKHPDHVNVGEEWFFNNAGGAMGGMFIIHASITEYLIIFGTAIGTEGHSGRHTSDDYFNILKGTQLAYSLGSFEPEVYPAGSVHHLHRGDVKQYKMPEGCFALEYARGWIPPMLFFGFADGFSSTLDVPTLWTTTKISAREIVGNLLKGKI